MDTKNNTNTILIDQIKKDIKNFVSHTCPTCNKEYKLDKICIDTHCKKPFNFIPICE